MPGIVGIIDKNENKEKNLQDIDKMLDTMLHESFYSHGKISFEELGIYIGWITHKDSSLDCMPIYNESKDLILFFSGEHFPDSSDISDLKQKQHTFQDGNASYLIHLYEDRKKDFYKTLNGKYNGVLIDKKNKRATIFNDRFGFQRMYYYEIKDKLIFSSEAKAILKICPECRSLRMDSLGQFFSFNCVLENKTLFENIYLLPGASKWIINKNRNIKKETYFHPDEWENQSTIDNKLSYEKIRNTFINILPRYFPPGENIALSLTGGFDTRIILANRDNPPGSLPCFTFGGMYRDCYDVKVARKVATACNQTHQTLKLDKKFLSMFPDLAEKVVYISDGALDLGGVPNLYVNKLVRKIAPIRMTGNYGQEVLQAYRAFKPGPPCSEIFNKDFLKNIYLANEVYNHAIQGNTLTFTLFKQAPWYQYGMYNLEQSQVIVRAPFMDNDLVKLMYQVHPNLKKNENIATYLIKNGQNSELINIMTDRGFLGKLPFLIHKLVRLYFEFTFKMEYYSNYGMPRSLAKANFLLAALKFEKFFIERHKYFQLGIWSKNELSNYIKNILLDNKTLSRPYLNKEHVQTIVNSHIHGYKNHFSTINKLITSELIQRQLIEM